MAQPHRWTVVVVAVLALTAVVGLAARPDESGSRRASGVLHPSHYGLATPLVMHVAPTPLGAAPNAALGTCGVTARHPCGLGAALRHAPPHTTLRLAPGVYTGGHRVTTSLRLEKDPAAPATSTATFDGEGAHRPLWFDGVPAQIEGLSFQNGRGGGAGCVLVTMAMDDAATGTSIRRCSFSNCTAFGSGPTGGRAAGGAVAVVYGRVVQRTIEVSSSLFEGNAGRGGIAAGGLLVRYATVPGPATAATAGEPAPWRLPQPAPGAFQPPQVHFPSHSPTTTTALPVIAGAPGVYPGDVSSIRPRVFCRTYLLDAIAPALQKQRGVYRIYQPRVAQVAGRPVYVSRQPREGVATTVLAFCEVTGGWVLFSHKGLLPVEVLTSATVCSSAQFVHLPEMQGGQLAFDFPEDQIHWQKVSRDASGRMTYEASGLHTRFQCQDLGHECPDFTISHTPEAQAMRAGTYLLMPNVVLAGRPVFARVGPNDTAKPEQYVWFCAPLEEWIVTEDHPEAPLVAEGSCRRGIASPPTRAMHPLFVARWRYWDASMSAWRQQTPTRAMQLRCAPRHPSASCSAVQVCGGVEPRAVMGPFLRAASPDGDVGGRPSFIASGIGLGGIYYCPAFSEWGWSTVFPRGPDGAMLCRRSLSSHATERLLPSHGLRFAHLMPNNTWSIIGFNTTIACVEHCSSVIIEGARSGVLGVYHAVTPELYSAIDDAPHYLQSQAPFHRLCPVLAAADATNGSASATHQNDPQAIPYPLPRRRVVAWSVVPNDVRCDSTAAVLRARAEVFATLMTELPALQSTDSGYFATQATAPPSAAAQQLSQAPSSLFHVQLFECVPPTGGPLEPCEPFRLHLACNLARPCPSVTVSKIPKRLRPLAAGVYALTSELRGGRPVYRRVALPPRDDDDAATEPTGAGGDAGGAGAGGRRPATTSPSAGTSGKGGVVAAELYYCEPWRRWIIGPPPLASSGQPTVTGSDAPPEPGRCRPWIASRLSGASVPTEAGYMDLEFDAEAAAEAAASPTADPALRSGAAPPPDSVWKSLNVSLSIVCSNAAIDDATLTAAGMAFDRASQSATVSDIISHCNFTSNSARAELSASTAGGAVFFFGSQAHLGDTLAVALRRVTFQRNDATATGPERRGAGGVAVINPHGAFFPSPTVLAVESQALRNVGPAGGLLADSVVLTGQRMTLSHNTATHSGGGLAVYGPVNSSMLSLTCRGNSAWFHGGCVFLESAAGILLQRGELRENRADGGEGHVLHGGAATIEASVVECATGVSVTAPSTRLRTSEIVCGEGGAATFVSGFGCAASMTTAAAHLPLPTGPSSGQDDNVGGGGAGVCASGPPPAPWWSLWGVAVMVGDGSLWFQRTFGVDWVATKILGAPLNDFVLERTSRETRLRAGVAIAVGVVGMLVWPRRKGENDGEAAHNSAGAATAGSQAATRGDRGSHRRH